MQTFNRISSAIFDVLLAPFGHGFPAFDLLVWPALMGVVAILVIKRVSNQKALTRVKSQISMRLLEIRLFSHDILQVLRSTGMIVLKNFLYLGNHMLPMIVMIGPIMAIVVQLVAHYAYAPAPSGAVELLRVQLDPAAQVAPRSLTLEVPDGVSIDAPMVPTADGQVFWRLRADRDGDHVLAVNAGGERFEKRWAVGGEARKVPLKRLRGFEAFLFPGEEALPSDGPLRSMELGVHTRPLSPFPEGELGIVIWAMLLSLVAGFALKGLFGVTI